MCFFSRKNLAGNVLQNLLYGGALIWKDLYEGLVILAGAPEQNLQPPLISTFGMILQLGQTNLITVYVSQKLKESKR